MKFCRLLFPGCAGTNCKKDDRRTKERYCQSWHVCTARLALDAFSNEVNSVRHEANRMQVETIYNSNSRIWLDLNGVWCCDSRKFDGIFKKDTTALASHPSHIQFFQCFAHPVPKRVLVPSRTQLQLLLVSVCAEILFGCCTNPCLIFLLGAYVSYCM